MLQKYFQFDLLSFVINKKFQEMIDNTTIRSMILYKLPADSEIQSPAL